MTGNDLTAVNTWTQLAAANTVTYRMPTTRHNSLPFTAGRDQGIDYILCKYRWINAWTNDGRGETCPIGSDHWPVTGTMKTKFALKAKQANLPRNINYEALTPEQIKKFNEDIKGARETTGAEKTLTGMANAIKKATDNLPARTTQPRQHYIREATWAPIMERQEKRVNGAASEEIEELNKAIREMTKGD